MPQQRILARLHAAVHRILWEEWDPIGVFEFGEDAKDEYDGYIPGVVGLLVHDADERRIFEHLTHIAAETINLLPGEEQHQRTRRAAALLVDEGGRILRDGGV